jgi:hypothetical protein
MFAKELIGIVQEALDRKGSDNPLDRILVSAFVSTRSGGNKYQELFANPHFAEIRTLFARVLDPSRSGAEEAAAAILAYRDTIAAEIAGDKLMGISASRQIIKHVARTEFPEMWATAHLKLATTLGVCSAGSMDSLPEIVQSLEKCLTVFTEQRHESQRGFAHYNLAMALSSSNWDDWDTSSGGEGDRTKRAILHGRKTLELMDKGIRCGDRAALSEQMVKLLILGNPQRKLEPVSEAISILERLKKSAEFKALSKSNQKSLNEYLNQIREGKRRMEDQM